MNDLGKDLLQASGLGVGNGKGFLDCNGINSADNLLSGLIIWVSPSKDHSAAVCHFDGLISLVSPTTADTKELFKHVSHFNCMNMMLSWFPATETRAKVTNKCPNCGCTDESTAHITRCCNKGRTLIFSESITSLMQWLGDQQTDLEVVHLFRQYLSSRGTHTMASLLGQPS